MKKINITLIAAILALFIGQSIVFAQGTILPEASGKDSEADCNTLLRGFEEFGYTSDIARNSDDLLGCAIVTGRISVAMVPYFITYFSNYLLGIVSIIALLFVVIGGFMYTLGGLSQQKERGKTFIMNAIIGMVIAFLAWTIVNVIISAITG